MRNNIWVTTTKQAAHEIAYFLPFLILFNHFLVHLELAVAVLGLLICYLLGFAVGKYRMVRFLEWLFCLIIATVVSLLVVGMNWSGLSFIIAAFIAVNRGFSYRYFEWHELFRGNAYIFCICVYFAAPITSLFFTELKAFSPYLFWTGLYCLIHALFTLNSRQLEQAAHNNRNGHSIAKPIIRVNRLGTSILIIALIIMININNLSHLVSSWVLSAIGWITHLLAIISPDSEQLTGLNMESMGNELMVLPPAEKGNIAKLIDFIFYYGAYLLEIIFVIAVLYFIIFKLLIPLYSRFITKAKLERESAEGYSDEEEKLETPNLGNWFRSMMKRNPSILAPTDNKERVRYLYRETLRTAIKRGQQFQRSQTPLEIEQVWHVEKANHRLPSRLVALYNKARYGESQITEEEMKQLKEKE